MARDLAATVAADVTKVKKAATVLIEEDGGIFGYRITNEANMLSSAQGLIAVIGPTPDFDKAVLAEIGIGHTKPYGEMHHIRLEDGSEARVLRRQTRFQMSLEQYNEAAALIFVGMGQVAYERTKKWRFTTWTNEKMSHVRSSKSGRKVIRFRKDYEMVKGIRFSVSIGFAPLIADLLWAEKRSFRDYYVGLGQVIDMRLAPYRRNGYSRLFNTLLGAKDLIDIVESRDFLKPAYRRSQALEFLPKGDQHPLYYEIAKDVFGHDFSKVPEEIQIMKAGLPDPEQRISPEIYCRGISTFAEAKDNMVFEVSWRRS